MNLRPPPYQGGALPLSYGSPPARASIAASRQIHKAPRLGKPSEPCCDSATVVRLHRPVPEGPRPVPAESADRAGRDERLARGVARQSAAAQGAGARRRRRGARRRAAPRLHRTSPWGCRPQAARGAETMDKIRIRGGVPLDGVIPIGGAKNAALPLMAASLLTRGAAGPRQSCPTLADIATMANLLVQHGAAIASQPARLHGRGSNCRAAHITSTTAPYDLVRKMRASVLVLGPLARALRRGARLAAGRLRDRCAAGRSAHQGAAPARRRGRVARGLYRGARAEGAARRRDRVSRRSRSAPPRTC